MYFSTSGQKMYLHKTTHKPIVDNTKTTHKNTKICEPPYHHLESSQNSSGSASWQTYGIRKQCNKTNINSARTTNTNLTIGIILISLIVITHPLQETDVGHKCNHQKNCNFNQCEIIGFVISIYTSTQKSY